MIITFSGVDCAGKSTQIELLRQYLISQGKTVTVFWYRPGYSDEIQKAKDLIRWGIQRIRKHRKPAQTKEQSDVASTVTVQTKVPASIWLTTALLDTTAQWTCKLRCLEKKYDVVICDRYVEDALLDLSMKFPQISWPNEVLKKLTLLFPKPDCSILLWLPYDEMLQRVIEKNEPFPDDEKTRQKRYRAYHMAADDDGFTVIDSSGPKELTHAKIIQAVTKVNDII